MLGLPKNRKKDRKMIIRRDVGTPIEDRKGLLNLPDRYFVLNERTGKERIVSVGSREYNRLRHTLNYYKEAGIGDFFEFGKDMLWLGDQTQITTCEEVISKEDW